MHEEIGWPTPEEEAILDRVNNRIGEMIRSGEIVPDDYEELERDCREARENRLRREPELRALLSEPV